MKRALLPLLMTLSMTACVSEPVKVAAPDIVPFVFSLTAFIPDTCDKAADFEHSHVRSDWANTFPDPDLQRLIARSLINNLDIDRVRYQYYQVETDVRVKRANEGPVIDLSALAEKRVTKTPAGRRVQSSSFGVGLDLNYDLDLWGNLDLTTKSALYDLEIASQIIRATELDVAGTITSLWYQAAEQQQLIVAMNKHVDTAHVSLRLYAERAQKGMGNSIDVTKQAQIVAALRADKLLMQERLELIRHELATLSFQPIHTFVLPEKIALPTLTSPRMIAPEAILLSRPDLVASHYQLEQANVHVSQATAQSMPQFNLSASLTSSSSIASGLLSGWAASIVASVVAPIFDGGENQAKVDKQHFLAEEMAVNYARSVLVAVNEIEDAMTQIYYRSERFNKKGAELNSANNVIAKLKLRESMGVDNAFARLREQSRYHNVEQETVRAKFDIVYANILLLKSLGGSTQQKKPVPTM